MPLETPRSLTEHRFSESSCITLQEITPFFLGIMKLGADRSGDFDATLTIRDTPAVILSSIEPLTKGQGQRHRIDAELTQ